MKDSPSRWEALRRHLSRWLAIFALLLLAAGCGGSSDSAPPASITAGGANPTAAGDPLTADPGSLNGSPFASSSGGVVIEEPAPPPPPPLVEIATSMGVIQVELFRDESPVTVENFLSNYVNSGFYSGTIFHYVVDGFMIAGGGYTPDLQGKETKEEIFNEAKSHLKNVRGTIAMVRDPEYSVSATSQFFFNLADNPGLDRTTDQESPQEGYCVFGRVTAGMDVLDRIAKVEVQDTDTFQKLPVQPVIIESITQIR